MKATPLNELSAGPREKKVFLFDFDGVLVDSLGGIALSVNATLEHFGFPPVDTETVRGFVGDGARRLISRIFSVAAEMTGRRTDAEKPLSFSDGDIDSFLLWYRAYYEAHATEKTQVYPGIRELLQKIKEAGAHAAVVTNKPSSLASIISERLGIAEYLDAIIGPEAAGGKTKPAPDGLIEALRRINILASESGRKYSARDALMTGDSPQDVLAGKNFGCETCAVLKGYTAPSTLFEAGADFYVNLAGDLGNIFA